MADKIDLPKQESMPSQPQQEGKYTSELNYFSSATHPSVRSRNHDDLFKRIRSGNDILCRLPSRPPALEFSDDDEEEDEEGKNENKIPEVEKTPEFQPKSQEIQYNNKTATPYNREKYTTPEPNRFNQKYSAFKLPPTQGNSYANLRNAVPFSENKVRTQSALSDLTPKAGKNLASGQEFKVPLAASFSARKSNLTDSTITVNDKSYSVLSHLGSGGSCKVYSGYNPEKKLLVAIKCVDLKNTDPLIREGYKKEIEYLKKLQDSNRVIKMYDYEYRQNELFLVLERGDIDFAKYISNEAKLKRLSPLMIKFYWAQMLEAVADIHKYGIVHSDLKPANFLLVAGNLKLIDFGIATSVPDDKTSTFRDTQVGTLNYMSPEAITQLSTSESQQVCFKVGVKSDVWSLGCILYNLVYGVTPFHNMKTLLQKIQAITNPNHLIEFRPLADKLVVDVLRLCLERDLKKRASVDELLKHPYLMDEKASAKAADNVKVDDLSNVMAQMQGLTPRRMSYLTKVVKELSEHH